MDAEKQLEILMEMIAYGGEAKSMAMDAIAKGREGATQEALTQVEAAEKSAYAAHDLHSDLLAYEVDNDLKVTMLTVHAADHLAEADTAILMAREIIALYAKLDQMKKGER